MSLNAAKEALLECMPALKDEAMTQTELIEAASIPTRETGRKALNELFSLGRIERTGKGIRNDLFRYFLGETPEPRPKTKSRVRHNQAIQKILKGEGETPDS